MKANVNYKELFVQLAKIQIKQINEQEEWLVQMFTNEISEC